MIWLVRKLASDLSDIRRWGLKPRDRVLDVGSGHNPHLRADVLCDSEGAQDSQRPASLGIHIDRRPFYQASAQSLPFPDRSFDFVICRHLVEHVEDPGELLGELTRVGRRGYIETPSPAWELLNPTSYHRWMVQWDGDRLHFWRKHPAFFENLKPLPLRYRRGFEALVRHAPETFLTRWVWESAIPYCIEGVEGRPHPRVADRIAAARRLPPYAPTWRRRVTNALIYAAYRRVSAPKSWEGILP